MSNKMFYQVYSSEISPTTHINLRDCNFITEQEWSE